MTMLVSLDRARAHLRADDDYPAEQIQIYLEAAEEQAQAFLNRNVYADADELATAVLNGTAGDDPIVVNKSIMAAVLLITGHLFANREDTIIGTIGSDLPMGSRTLLQPWRVGLGV